MVTFDPKLYDVAEPYIVGKDKLTYEDIKRKRTYPKVQVISPENVSLTDIDAAIKDYKSMFDGHITSMAPWLASSDLLMLADLLISRAKKGDRKEAYDYLNRLLSLSCVGIAAKDKKAKSFGIQLTDKEMKCYGKDDKGRDLVEHPEIAEAQAKVGLAYLTLQQINDNEKPFLVSDQAAAMAKAIQYCDAAILVLSKSEPASERDYFALGRAHLIKAKLLAMSDASDKDVRDELLLANQKWDKLAPIVDQSKYYNNKDLLRGYSKDVKIKSAQEGILYLNAWSDVERAKLLTQKVKVKQAEITAYCGKLDKAIGSKETGTGVEGAMAALDAIRKGTDYVAHDALVAKADLMAKKARLLDNDALRLEAIAVYKEAQKSSFADIRALGIAGEIALTMEIGSVGQVEASNYLAQYFDPTATVMNIKYPFNFNSYSYLAMELLEAKLRNIAQRTTVSVNCKVEGSDKLPDGTCMISDPKLAELRAAHIKKATTTIFGLRDRTAAIADLKARAMLEEATAMTLSVRDMDNKELKEKKLRAALELITGNPAAKFEGILTVLGETTADIEAADIEAGGERRLEGSFYVALYATWAGILEQIAWLKNENMEVKDASLFTESVAKYKKVKELCKYSTSKYDNLGANVDSPRQLMVDLSLAGINTANLDIDVVVTDPKKVVTNVNKLNQFIADARVTAPKELTGAKLIKFNANVQRVKFEALCKILYFLNKQDPSVVDSALGELTINGKKYANKEAAMKGLIADIKDMAKALVPTEPGTESPLEDPYFVAVNMMGVNSVDMRYADKDVAAGNIKAYYVKYIFGKKRPMTYSMVDAVAVASVQLKDGKFTAMVEDAKTHKMIEVKSTLKEQVLAYLNRLIDTSKNPVTLAKAYVWRARLKSWSFDDRSTGATLFDNALAKFQTTKKGDRVVPLMGKDGKPVVIGGALADYKKAIELYASIEASGKGAALYENGASKMALFEEYNLTMFRAANYSLKGTANVAERVAFYQLVASDINGNIKGKSTSNTGFNAETVKKLDKEDKAARVKAQLTLGSIAMSLTEPLENGSITIEAVRAILGDTTLTDSASLFAYASTKFEKQWEIINQLIANKTMNGPELQDFGLDTVSVSRRIAEAYMVQYLIASEPLEMIKSAKELKARIEDLIAKAKEAIKDGSKSDAVKAAARKMLQNLPPLLATLNQAISKAESRSASYTARATAAKTGMDKYLGLAKSNSKAAGVTARTKAEVVLLEAQFTGWTAGKDVSVLMSAIKGYENAIATGEGAIDAQAMEAYGEALTTYSFIEGGSDRKSDAIAVFDGLIGEKSSAPEAVKAKAYTKKANVIKSQCKEDVNTEDLAKLRLAREACYGALAMICGPYPTGDARDKTTYFTDKVKVLVYKAEAMKLPIDKTMIEALAYLGTIEARLYTGGGSGANSKRISDYADLYKKMSDINSVLVNFQGDPDPSLKEAIMSDGFIYFRNHMIRAYHDALSGSAKAEFAQKPECVAAFNAKDDYAGMVSSMVKALGKIK